MAEPTGGGGVDTTVLYVDGVEATRTAVRSRAAERRPSWTVDAAAGIESALAAAESGPPDCVVAGYDLQDGDGIELHDELRASGYDGPFLLFTDHPPAEIARAAFAAGVDDFVQKRHEDETYDFLLDKVAGAIDAQSADVEYASGGDGRDVDTMVALADVDGDVEWTAGELPELLPSSPAPEAVYEAMGAVLDNDETFRTHLARTDAAGLTEPQAWRLEDGEGAVEHQRVEFPTDGWLDIFRDISTEYEREERLRRFERLLETAQDGLYALDPNGCYTYVNESMAETVGYEREEMLGMHAGTVLGEEDYERGQASVQDLVADSGRESEVLELCIETADGEELPVSIHFAPLYDDAGDYDGLVGVLRDITDRKVRERRYRTLAENIPRGSVSMFDDDLRYTLVEGQLFDNIDYDAADFEGTTLAELHTEGYVEQFGPLYEAVFEGERSSFEFDHAGRYYRSNLAPIRDASGDVVAGLEMVLDVTEQREYERELERQNERLGEFASIVSHDLRNPLNVIEGRLQLYRERGDETHLDAVEDSVAKMEHLIDDLLELAKQGQTVGDLEPVSLDAVVDRCRNLLDTADATVETDDLGRVRADPGRLTQLFENLCRNAVEHAGPDVTVRVGTTADGFFLEDDGPGIPPERRDDVLEYGVTDSDGGTGIGLAIVSEIAEAHGWTVTVADSDDGGARFEFGGVDRPERTAESAPQD
jgi:PAS domain S-box-containing protein